MTIPQSLPGSSVVEAGLRDAAAGVESTAALLVAVGAPRLRKLGYEVKTAWPEPEYRLYARLADEFGSDAAHSRYNALIRQLVSFERAATCVG
jgi:hypothetical protein